MQSRSMMRRYAYALELFCMCVAFSLLLLAQVSRCILRPVWDPFSSIKGRIFVSSTIFMAYGRPAMMMSDCQHPSSEDAFKPIGALRYLNLPC